MVERRSSTQLGEKEDEKPNKKLYSRFLFKALILAVLCAVVPVFLSQSPELANKTRLLEFLHLVFVGIAVSYGLFSRRNYDKADHHHNLPKILEVSSSSSSVHHHESESDDSSGDYSKIQTWKNKHHLKIPEIVQSKDHGGKPLLLPVRSLRVSDSGDRWEKVRSKRKLLKNLLHDHDHDDNTESVLPSPIPWRSRSSESQPSIKNLTSAEDAVRKLKFQPSPPPPPPPPPLPAFYNSPTSRKLSPGIYRIESRESVHKKKFVESEFHPPPPPPPPPPVDYYKSSPAKLKVSSERRKSSENKTKTDERSSKRNSTRKVQWCNPIADSKESEDEEEHRRGRRREEEDDEMKEKKIEEEEEEEEEGVCGSNNGSDVDKKADEFIAKFREQIRLQRIDSIKKSAYKISSANSSSSR